MSFKLLIVGENSFLAKSFYREACEDTGLSVKKCGHEHIPQNIDVYDWVVNFSFNSSLYSNKYEESLDQDRKLANLLKFSKTKLVIISSRAIYGSFKEITLHKETKEINSALINTYGKNKIKSETSILNILGNSRSLICRASNIFGEELGSKNFMGTVLNTLFNENKIILDVDIKSVRDFLPVEYFSKALLMLITNNAYGVYNLGSGIGLRLSEICNATIDGYGSGIIEYSGTIYDQFIMDTSKLQSATGFMITKEKILAYAYNVGLKLKNIKNEYE
ncbi:NAD-dependent epimerase/dehydratase family protein [Gammaproteobacteria bacterium]|nr:NAD-dependent epimerase/dehydratase family protein [Gammaproteobacteria bacterium]